jgi:3-dehydroquinate dehydratase/shikimate dehydrogenase
MSAHNFRGRFDDIGKLYRRIQTIDPAAIPKLVYQADHINDCFEALDLLHQSGGDRIVLCMGKAGLLTRIIAKKLGGFVTFASVDAQSATAPGQLTAKQLKKLYRWDWINDSTQLYGIIGSPVGHSASPAIHNACFGDIRANKLYLPLLVEGAAEELGRFFDKVTLRSWLDFRGFSVTLPHKVGAIEYVKSKQGEVEPLAEKIGAANTVLLNADGRFRAYNTDYAGALDAITEVLGIERADMKDMSVAVIGAGGVARAVVAGLRDIGAAVMIYNRTVKKAEKLAMEFDCEYTHLNDLPELDAQLIINCTSIGMHPDIEDTPVPPEVLKKTIAVFDTVYNPARTKLLKLAKNKRAKTIDGVSMLVNQALAQFRFFTGQSADSKKMRRIVTRFLVTNG